MTEYTDIDQVSRLTAEQRNIAQALDILDQPTGTIVTVSVAAPPDVSAVTVGITDAAQAMISGVTAGLMQRYNEINRELEVLGIENVPPNWSGGGPPIVETQPA